MPHFHLIKNGHVIAEITVPFDDREEVLKVARPIATEDADLEIKMEKDDGSFVHFETIIRDTTSDGLEICPHCGSEMDRDKSGHYCPECDYRVDL